jgi:hypothetical protein
MPFSAMRAPDAESFDEAVEENTLGGERRGIEGPEVVRDKVNVH